MRSIRSVLTIVLLVASLVAGARQVSAQLDANAWTWTETFFPSADGTILHADVFLPADREPTDTHPVIVSIGPYFGTNPLNAGLGSRGPVLRFADLMEDGHIFERGYAFVQVDSRGYGSSGGCNDFGGLGEQVDAVSSVEWAAAQPWSTGRVATWGKSYDAWTQVMALAGDPDGLEAAVVQAPLIEAYRGMFLNGVHYNYDWYLTPSLYAAYDLAPSTAADSTAEEYLYPAAGTATNPHCYALNASMTPVPERGLPYWMERDIVDAAAGSDVPVFWTHGFNDANTKPDNFLPVFDRLRGPKRAWVGQWAHDRANQVGIVGRDGFMDEAMAFLDHHLKGAPPPTTPAVTVQDGEGRWRHEASWPPDDAGRHTFPLRSGVYADRPVTWSGGATPGVWTFTPTAPHDVHLSGVSTLRAKLNAVPAANLIALVYDVSPDRRARLISRGASLVPIGGSITTDLYPQDHVLRAGHRLGVHITAVDSWWFSPTHTWTDVAVKGASLEVPYLETRRTPTLDGGPARAMGSVPVVYLDAQLIEQATVDAPFPPPMHEPS